METDVLPTKEVPRDKPDCEFDHSASLSLSFLGFLAYLLGRSLLEVFGWITHIIRYEKGYMEMYVTLMLTKDKFYRESWRKHNQC